MKFKVKVVGIVLILLLAGLLIVLLKENKQDAIDKVEDNNQTEKTEKDEDLDKRPDTNQDVQDKLVVQIPSEKVNKIVIYNGIQTIELLPESPYSEEEVRTNLSGWYIHQPYKNVYSVKYNQISDMLYGLTALKRERVLDENTINLDEFDLKNVDFKISIGSEEEEETILIGAPANSDSYYAKLETDDKIFTISKEALDPYSYQAFDIVEKFVKIVAIDVLKQLTIQYPDGELIITVEHEEDVESKINVAINGEKIEEKEFRDLYKVIAGLSVKEAIEDAKYKTPEATMTYTILDSNKGEKEVKVEFVPYNEKNLAVFINNKADFLIEKEVFYKMIDAINSKQ